MTPATLARLTMGDACDAYAAGTLGQVDYEAYRRAWAIAGGAELGYHHAAGWTRPSDDPAVEQLAGELVAIAERAR